MQGDDSVIVLDNSDRQYDDVLTVKGLMDYLAIGKNTAYELLKSGKIKHIKIGRNYKIPKESLREYLAKEIR